MGRNKTRRILASELIECKDYTLYIHMCIFRHGSVTETVCHYRFRKPNHEESITKITYFAGHLCS